MSCLSLSSTALIFSFEMLELGALFLFYCSWEASETECIDTYANYL